MTRYLIRRLFIRFMLRTKKTKVAIAIQGMPSSSRFKSSLPKIKSRVILTTWVKGRKAKTAY